MKLRGRKCRRWPSPITATCLPRRIFSTKPASATSRRSSAAKCTSPKAAGTSAARNERRAPANGSRMATKKEPGARGSNHLVLLCEILEGYHNLIKLVSAGFLEGFYYKPRIDYDLLAKHSKGLIALSRVPERAGDRGGDGAENTIRRARTPTDCATFSARIISFWKFRIKGWKSRSRN